MAAGEDVYSQIEVQAFHAPTVFVHVKIPPCTTIGHKADFWGVDKPDYTCSLRCFARGDTFILRLFEHATGEVFAEASWPPDRPLTSVVDPAVDSSRYFALKITNPVTNEHTFIGMGFADRETASEFKGALQEHQSYLTRMAEAEVSQKVREQQPVEDLSLGDANIKIVLPGISDTSKRRPGGLMSRMLPGPKLFNLQESTQTSGDAIPRVVPPPCAEANTQAGVSGENAGQAASTARNQTCSAEALDDDDFGDFVG